VHIEARLQQLGLALPAPVNPPAGVRFPFAFVRVRGNRAFVSGHGPLDVDGSIAKPLGKLGRELTVDEGYRAARELGDLDRVRAWLRVFGMVASAPGFGQQPAVINGCSDLIIELYGPDGGKHARSAVGMAELPFNIPVEIEAEVEIEV
jgi:enamine deaminase RidA (YjgF/YER057c/UK114 family)